MTPPSIPVSVQGPTRVGSNGIVYSPGPESLWLIDKLANRCGHISRNAVVDAIVVDWLYEKLPARANGRQNGRRDGFDGNKAPQALQELRV